MSCLPEQPLVFGPFIQVKLGDRVYNCHLKLTFSVQKIQYCKSSKKRCKGGWKLPDENSFSSLPLRSSVHWKYSWLHYLPKRDEFSSSTFSSENLCSWLTLQMVFNKFCLLRTKVSKGFSFNGLSVSNVSTISLLPSSGIKKKFITQ